jgi:hypothetical protein
MLYSLAHFRPLVNGYSGFTPQSHQRLFRMLGRFPDDAGLAELERLGVRYAVFHRDRYTDREWDALLDRAAALPDRLSLVASFEQGRVYELVGRELKAAGDPPSPMASAGQPVASAKAGRRGS